MTRAVLGFVLLIVLIAVIGFFAVPPLAKSKLQDGLTEALGRRTTIGRIEFNPFTLKATLHDLAVADRGGGGTLFAFDTMDVDATLASIRHRAPVLEALRVVRPRLALVRHADGSSNIQDLLDRMLQPSEGPPARFSLNNIEVQDGEISFDDRPLGRKDVLTKLEVALPFLSSLPYDAEIRVAPRLSADVNGTPFALQGNASSPFADVKEATLEVNLDALPLPRYVDYVPVPLDVRVASGSLTTRLKIAFVTEKGAPRTLTVSGDARIDGLKIARKDGTPLASAASLRTTLGTLDVIHDTLVLERVDIERPDIDLRRLPGGAFELASLIGTEGRKPAPAASSPKAARGAFRGGASATPARSGTAPRTLAAPWTVELVAASVVEGTIRLSDRAVKPAFQARSPASM